MPFLDGSFDLAISRFADRPRIVVGQRHPAV
jgi:hypothetical protein